MDIRCPSCSKLFRVADEKIAGKGIRFKCSKCAEVITITKDDFEMDLLAREGEAVSPETQPSAPAVKTVEAPPPPPPSTPEPEAREYKPPPDQPGDEDAAGDQAIPPSSLTDFDFSEPHAAAAAAAHPDDGFGGAGFSFDASAEQDAAPEIEISPEAAAEAESALQFPDDLISEPKRKPAFGSAEPEVTTTQAEEGPAVNEQEIDLGAALAMPTGAVSDDAPDTMESEPAPGPTPTPPKGPVISPELLAQMKRNALERSAVKVRTAPSAGDDIDLGAALAMPKTVDAVGRVTATTSAGNAAPSKAGESTSSRKTLLVGGAIALLLVAALAVLYAMGYLGGTNVQDAQQPGPQQQAARKSITAEGLSIVDPSAFIDPEHGDIVIRGKIANSLDKPKAGWFLVAEVRDVKETVLATVKMVNGTQVYTERDRELLVKRGRKPEQIRSMSEAGEGKIPAGGSVSFEVRVPDPPAGSARFLPMLRSFDPAMLEKDK